MSRWLTTLAQIRCLRGPWSHPLISTHLIFWRFRLKDAWVCFWLSWFYLIGIPVFEQTQARFFGGHFLVAFFSGIYSACPDDWVQNGDSCYYVSSNYGISLPWHEAHSKCESMAGGLVVVETELENVRNNVLAWQCFSKSVKYLGSSDAAWIRQYFD